MHDRKQFATRGQCQNLKIVECKCELSEMEGGSDDGQNLKIVECKLKRADKE